MKAKRHPGPKGNSLGARALRFLGSFELAFSLFVLLGALTFLGTLEQQHMSLFDVQAKYFESIILVYWIGGAVPLPLPGGYLLLTILFANIIVGGILRMRKRKATVGVLIAHLGIVGLLLGSFVEHQLSTKGQLTLYEGESGSHYESMYEWEVAVREVPRDGEAIREFVVPDDEFEGLDTGGSLRYRHPDLPFDLVLVGYARNSKPRQATPEEVRMGVASDGFVLQALEDAGPDGYNLPGLTAILQPKQQGERARRAILWGPPPPPHDRSVAPWIVDREGAQYQVELRRKQWELDFTLALKDFVVKWYPGTRMAKEYSSYATMFLEGTTRDIHITMNEPLRHQGVTVYQTGWGPQNPRPGTRPRLWSTFSVVENPSDRVPLIMCIVIAAGLLIHFVRKLALHIEAEAKRRQRVQVQPKGSPA